jgi:hypothetical protein
MALFEGPHTGNSVIDSLQVLQAKLIMRDSLTEKERLDQFRIGVRLADPTEYIDQDFMVSGLLALGRSLDSTTRKREVLKDITFMGRLTAVKYLNYLDDKIQIDSMTVNFVNPEILASEDPVPEGIERMLMELPVLGIKSCIGS